MFDLVGKRYWYFLFSLLVILIGLLSLLVPPGLRWGIEFSSGSTMSLGFNGLVTEGELRGELALAGLEDAIIQHLGGDIFFVRTRVLEEGEGFSEKEEVKRALEERFGTLKTFEFSSVSPIVAQETVRNAALAVVVASLGILLYITWAFRRVPKPFRYGVCAVVALFHDVLVVVGIFSILAKLLNVEINSMFITALLTVIGYSVHDTIVVFDRLRENLGRSLGRNFEETVNSSIFETLGRSLNTTLTLVFTLLALYLFGGVTIRNFILVLLIGIVSGTYSSIFIASQLLVVWERGEARGIVRRIQLRLAGARGGGGKKGW